MTDQHAISSTSQRRAAAESHTSAVAASIAAPVTASAADDSGRARAHTLLLEWYAREGRAGLPWRATRDPYAILVSEVMLQQTQVDRVIPKYLAFLERFPTLAALAEAPTAEVIRAWAGLGYNMRAVRLQEIARQALRDFGGKLPEALDDLLRLKGVGRYTAGAVAAFAFGAQVATVDTNIRRTLWRIFRGIEPLSWPTGEAATRETLALAEWALPPEHAYDWQQALMDLGATVCVARRPACERCPLTEVCAAWAAVGAVTLFPSGEALARLRDEQMSGDARMAETGAAYAVAQPARRSRKGAQPFTRTTRYFRGRIIAALRTLEPGASLSLSELGPLTRPEFADDDLPWLRKLVDGLARDGLARLTSGPEGEPADLRVSLP